MTETTMLIEKARLEFLVFAFFGSCKEPFPAVSKRAYRDLCRTLLIKGKDGSTCRTQVDTLIEKNVVELLDSKITSQFEYDQWHYDTCIKMKRIYKAKDIIFTFGHAQKWINMSLKYLYMHGAWDLSRVFAFFHVPIDSYILSIVEEQLQIERPCNIWSKIDDYVIYLGYQRAISEKLHNQPQPVEPLRWEFASWLIEAESKYIASKAEYDVPVRKE